MWASPFFAYLVSGITSQQGRVPRDSKVRAAGTPTMSGAADVETRSSDHDRDAARAVSRRADRLLLPDAGLSLRGGGRGSGDHAARVAEHGSLRGPGVAALLAVPDRHERLPRHAGRSRAPRPPDGSRPGAGADRSEPPHAARDHLDPADARQPHRVA